MSAERQFARPEGFLSLRVGGFAKFNFTDDEANQIVSILHSQKIYSIVSVPSKTLPNGQSLSTVELTAYLYWYDGTSAKYIVYFDNAGDAYISSIGSLSTLFYKIDFKANVRTLLANCISGMES